MLDFFLSVLLLSHNETRKGNGGDAHDCKNGNKLWMLGKDFRKQQKILNLSKK